MSGTDNGVRSILPIVLFLATGLGCCAAARADSVSALLSHLEPLRVLPERRLPADFSLPGHILKRLV